MVKISFILFLLTPVLGRLINNNNCTNEDALRIFKRSTYEFSVRLLDRVAHQTDYHFVYSPTSTWLQLVTLADGARRTTETEIRQVTRYHPSLCFRRKFKNIINNLYGDLSNITKRANVIVFHELLDVKKSYLNEIRKSHANKIITVNFNKPEEAAAKANEVIETNMDGVIKEALQAEDFNLTLVLMTDVTYFKGNWRTAFNPVYTSTVPFYAEEKVPKGNVRMMSQDGYFNLTELPSIKAKVLEIPFKTNDRISMLFFLPTTGSIQNLWYNMKKINLMTIFKSFETEGLKSVTVRIPRFNIRTELVDIPELLNDMGVHRIFSPELSNFAGITDHKMLSSLMYQIADIEITEHGATASAAPEPLTRDSTEEFRADRPFGYLIVDKKTNIIMFAGIYSEPSIY